MTAGERVPRRTFLINSANLSNYHTSFFTTNNSLVAYWTSTSACHMSCLKHGCGRAVFVSPPHANFCFCSLIFVDYVLILYDYRMAFSPICSVVYALGLRLVSRCYAVLQCPPHPNRARARFADPVRVPLRPCLPRSCLHHAVLLVIALFMSRHCAHTVQLHLHSIFVMLSGLLPHQ